MIGPVVADAGTVTNTAIATISTVAGSATTTATAAVVVAAAAAATAVAPGLAEAAWREIVGRSRIRKAVPSITSLTTKTAKSLTLLRGGAATGIAKKASTGNKAIESKGNNDFATRGKSVAFMALGMACHYLGKWFCSWFIRIYSVQYNGTGSRQIPIFLTYDICPPLI